MDWKTGYKPERKIDLADVAQIIRDTVTMEDVLDLYAPEIPRRNHRCPCPFHNGKDFNMSYSKTGFKCFVCGADGDVIGFVKDIRDMSTRSDAMKLINQDLHLGIPIGRDITVEQNSEIAKRRKAAQEKQKAISAWWDKYHTLLDEWIQCDKTIMAADPLSNEWCSAVKRKEILGYQLDNLPEEPR